MLCLFDTSKTSAQVANELATVIDGAETCNGKYNKKYCSYYNIKENKPTYKVDGVYAAADSVGWQGRIYLKNGIILAITQRSSCKYVVNSPVRDEEGFETGEMSTAERDVCAFLYIDTNGQNPPNQFGVDILRYMVDPEGKLKCDQQSLLNKALLYDRVEYTRYNFGDKVK